MTGAEVIKKTARKSVRFYQVYALDKGCRAAIEDIDWLGPLAKAAELDVEARTVDNVIFDPYLPSGEDFPALGMFKPLSTDFMSRIDPHTKEVKDIDLEESDLYAHSSAVVFLPGMNVFSHVGSSGMSSPQASAVRTFLKSFCPLPSGASWEVEPLMDPARLDTFRQSDAVTEFSAKYSTASHLLTPPSGNALEFGDKIARYLGDDVEISVRVKLANKRDKKAGQLLKDMVASSLERLAHEDSRARVKATKGLIDTEINLVAEKFAVTGEIPQVQSQSATFALLLQLARDVTTECHDRVVDLQKG